MIRIDIATLFPDMCESVLGESIIGRARSAGHIDIVCHNIRDYTEDKHNRVDDKPYGGGTGMVMQAQPVYDCIEDIKNNTSRDARVIYMSPQGKVLTQQKVKELAELSNIIILCGHYEGVDQRVLDELCAEEISVGDYVLTGGELPALILADAISRLQEGVLPNSDAYTLESHYNGLLEHPQYSRPEVWRGREVPQVLLTGHHDNIQKWQEEMSLAVTEKKRPDLLYNHRKNGKPYAQYVRIQGREISKSGKPFDIMAYARKLCHSRVFTNREVKQFKKIEEWFKQNLPDPVFDDSEYKKSAVIYYKSAAAVNILEMLMPVLDILTEHNADFDIIFTNTPGKIVYEDDVRIAVI